MIVNIPFLLISGPLVSFVVTFFFTMWLRKGSVSAVLDYPNSRSLHRIPVPRTGGIALISGVLFTWVVFVVDLSWIVWLGIVLLATISFADDMFGLSIWSRLFAHFLTAGGFSVVFLYGSYDWFILLLIVLGTVWLSNLYNFMDGSDGMAGGMTVIGFGCYGLAALLAGDVNFALMNFSISAAAMAFLTHNFFPARIFLGDVGSIPLGFLAAVLGVMGWIEGLWTLWLPVLVFSPFIADSTVTLIKRCLRGERVWLAHCEHYYQRAVQGGLGHRNTALLGYSLMLLTGASAVWASQYGLEVQHWVGMIWGFIYLVLMFVSDWSQELRVGSE